jgi:hypothetical protein
MHLDTGLIRKMLKLVEGGDTNGSGFVFSEAEAKKLGRSLDIIRYNLRHARERGFIKARSRPLEHEPTVHLTPMGLAFLQSS